MKLNVKAVAIAEALISAGLFILCRLAFVVAPDATLAALKYVTHNDWSSMAMPVTLGGFVWGLLVFTIFMAIVGAAWAWVYNLIAGLTAKEATTTKPGKSGYQNLPLE